MEILRDEIDFSVYEHRDEWHAVKPASSWLEEVLTRMRTPEVYVGDPLPWAKADGFRLRQSEVTVWAGINGHGKALCVDTPIPTPCGFKCIADLVPGDVVFDEAGQPCRVVASSGIQKGRPRYRMVFSDKSEIIADAEHEWVTWCAKARQSQRNSIKNGMDHFAESAQSHKRTLPSIRTTKAIADTITASGGCFDGMLNHSVMTAGAIDTPECDLPLDPYIFGLWLGDGDSYGGGFTTADTVLLNAFREAGFDVTKRVGRYHYGIRGLNAVLRSFGVLGNKHIPAMYRRASIRQRVDLLAGLMDTDGHVTEYGRCEVTSVRKQLAYDILDLVLSLGIQARVITGRATIDGRDCGEKYRVTFTPPFVCARLGSKAKRMKSWTSIRAKHRYIESATQIEDGDTVCIQVDSPSHMFLCGKSYIPTHNSMVLSQIMLNVMRFGKRVLLASMEMPPAKSIERMLRQGSCGPRPSERYAVDFHDWTDDRLWIYDKLGMVEPKKMLAVARYARDKFNVHHIVVDSLMKCGIGPDDYAGQKRFVDGLCAVALETGVHIHLVAHARKGEKETDRLDKFDIKGTSEIADQVDNIVLVHRNKRKEADREGKYREEPDCFLSVAKQRHGDWENTIGLWFHAGSQSFVPNEDASPVGIDL